MKAIFLKELRENLKWAVLAMAAMGAYLKWAITDLDAPELISDGFFFATISGFSMMALGVGLLQIFQDQWRGREAFIVHRPIQRSALFFGKILAGLLLYFIAAGVPLTVAIFWCHAHGYRTAPFEWPMVWPGIWDLINGTVVYFAALLIGSRDVKWFGSRLMPLAIPFFVSMLGFSALNIGEALAITAIALLILVPAAWSSFVHRGVFETQPLIFRAIQTPIITLGLAICLMTVNNIVLRNLGLIFNTSGNGWNYIIDGNGRLLRGEYEVGGITRTVDLADNAAPEPPEKGLAYLGFWPRRPEDFSFSARHYLNVSFHQRTSYLRRIYFADDVNRDELIYSIHRNVIEEFNTQRSRWIGTIGPDGFVPAPQTAKPFDRPILGEDGYFHDGKTVFHIGLEGKKIKPLFSVSPDDQIYTLKRFGDRTDSLPYNPYLAVLTEKSLRVYRGDQEVFNIPLPFGPPIYTAVHITAISNGHFAIFYEPDPRQNVMGLVHLIELDERGQIVRQTDAPDHPYLIPPWWNDVFLMLPSPLGLLAFGSLKAYFLQPFPPLSVIIEMVAIALLCGGAAAWWTRRYSLSPAAQMTWIIFSALMGIPGLLGLFAMRSWPARVKCPSCTERRIVTRESCEHCSSPFATPAMQGIEIFE